MGTLFNPLLSRLRQFSNAYKNRNDICDINVHYLEANLLIRHLETILILNLKIITVQIAIAQFLLGDIAMLTS